MFPFFNLLVCEIYWGAWARRERRAHGQVGHRGMLGTPFSRLQKWTGFGAKSGKISLAVRKDYPI